MTPTDLPGVGVGEAPPAPGSPHTTALFWAIWLLLICAFVAYQLFL